MRSVWMPGWIGALALGACTAYKPGTYVLGDKRFVGNRATVGCLDLAVARRPDHGAAAVLEYQFGNRCEKPVTVDLANVQVVGRTSDGREQTLFAYDPQGTLVALELGGRLGGHEAIAYLPNPQDVQLVQVCVDATTIPAGGPKRAPQWMCFARSDDPAYPGPAEPLPLDTLDAPAPQAVDSDTPTAAVGPGPKLRPHLEPSREATRLDLIDVNP